MYEQISTFPCIEKIMGKNINFTYDQMERKAWFLKS